MPRRGLAILCFDVALGLPSDVSKSGWLLVGYTTLLKVMLDQNTPASTKVRAADSVMNHALRALELEEVLERLTKLERAAGL